MKNYYLIVFLLVSIAIPQTGQCFYNPSDGRWLNRDPLEEEGGKNVYGFVKNSPLDGFDAKGLEPTFWLGQPGFYWTPIKPKCCGTCGPDITDALKKTLEDIKKTYAEWPNSKKLLAGGALAGVTADKEGAWDINELAYTSPSFQTFYQQSLSPLHQPYNDQLEKGSTACGCRDTVAVNGQCYYSSQVTYAMLGLMVDLVTPDALNNSFYHPVLDSAINAVRQRKQDQFKQDANSPWSKQAVAMTFYGAGYTPPIDSSLPDCKVDPKKQPKTHFTQLNWTWEPVRHRSYD